MPRTYGTRYHETRGLSMAEIGKRIRADFKKAQADGVIPADLRLAVRTRRHWLAPSVSVRITGRPRDAWWTEWDEHGHTHRARTAEAEHVLARVRALVFAYNYDGSDPQADLTDVRFTTKIRFGGEETE